MSETKTYTLSEIQQVLANLENGISEPQNERMSRAKIPIPEEYGGGWATGSTLEEAVRKLIERVGSQIKPATDAPTFRECWKKWIMIKEGQERSPCTISNYKRLAKDRLLPFFGDIPVDQITPDDIQLYFNSIMHLSKSYSIQSKAVLRGIFDRAERMGYVVKNLMQYEYVRSQKEKEKVVLQDEDLLTVISELDNLEGNDYLYVCFLCFTALRRGEILGLKWEDLDFEGEKIYVRRNVVYPDGVNDYIVKAPKDGSYGVVRLHSELAKRIERFQSKGFILYMDDDPTKPISRSSFSKMWGRIKRRVDLKGATSHCFRASYASMMNAHCDHIDPKVLQGALRHKTPDLALKVYAKKNVRKLEKAEKEYDDWIRSQLEQTS